MLGKNVGSDQTWQRIPLDSEGVEIGVWRGDSSAKFLRRARHLHLVDAWSVVPYQHSEEHGTYQNYLDRYAKIVGSRDPKDFQTYYDSVYESVVKRFQDQSVTIYRKTSQEFFREFDQQVDWVYVDADHSFEGCLGDLESSLRILRPGGKLLGDDYTNKPGVRRAVDEFCRVRNLCIDNFHGTQYEICIPAA